MPAGVPQVERAIQFCSLTCLSFWSQKAEAAGKVLVERAQSVQPHGTFRDPMVKGLIVP